MSEQQAVLGIDVSKAKLHVALLRDLRHPDKRKVVANTIVGFVELREWLQHQGVEQVHICLEATNTYGHGVAVDLRQAGHRVSLVNPARIQGFALSQLSRTKNDHTDAVTIAQFCRVMQPATWTPPALQIEQLQALTRRLEALQEMMAQEQHRLDTASAVVKPDIQAHIEFLTKQVATLKKSIHSHLEQHPTLAQQAQLLTSIVGIATQSAACILAEIGDLDQFRSTRQLAAYSGLTPQEHQSGTSVHSKARLCKIGNAHLRRSLYFPALVAIRRCPPLQQWRESLLARGKAKMQVVGAIMHKLIRIIYGVLKSGKPFEITMLSATA